jgi:predicted TIM-barrel fold metal-dependent hydrolase
METHHHTKMNHNEKPYSISRRKFIGTTGLLLAGSALKLNGASLLFSETEPIIDIHQHLNYAGRISENLITHQRAMGITTTILLPAGRPVNSASTNDGESNGLEAKITGNRDARKFVKQHPKEFLFAANEVPDVPNAEKEIEKYLKRGAVAIAESKFAVQCDSPEMQKIYELAQEYNVPVLMHWQHGRFNYGFDRFYTILEKYPKVNFIGHAQTWWANIDRYNNQTVLYPKGKVTPGGWTDRYLSDYPNMFGDLSAGSGLNALTRDEVHARNFFIRHQDKLMYGSDCDDADGLTPELCQGAQTIAAVRKLSATKQIERKLLYENAKKLFRI